MKAGNVFVRITQMELPDDVVPHPPRRARREGRDGAIRKFLPQARQISVIGTEFMSPFRNTVCFVDRKK